MRRKRIEDGEGDDIVDVLRRKLYKLLEEVVTTSYRSLSPESSKAECNKPEATTHQTLCCAHRLSYDP